MYGNNNKLNYKHVFQCPSHLRFLNLREIPCPANLGHYARHNDRTFCQQNITDITEERPVTLSHITFSPMVLADKQQNHADIVKLKQSCSTT